jgi:hypothetical protein
MRTLTMTLIISMLLVFFINAGAEQTAKEKTMHDIHAMMRMMDNALCEALEGANLQMFGKMGSSDKLDRDLMERGTKMIKDGKEQILSVLTGKEMKTLHKMDGFDEQIMLDLHALGDRMLHVIEEVEKLHESINEKVMKKQ